VAFQHLGVVKEGAKPPLQNLLPLMQGIHIHIMERGIKGERFNVNAVNSD